MTTKKSKGSHPSGCWGRDRPLVHVSGHALEKDLSDVVARAVRFNSAMPSRAPVILRNRVAASATAVTVQRKIILPPRQCFTRRDSRRTEPMRFSIAFVVDSWRSSFFGRRSRFTEIVSSRPSSSEAAAPGCLSWRRRTRWARLGVRLDRIDPGKPPQNGRHANAPDAEAGNVSATAPCWVGSSAHRHRWLSQSRPPADPSPRPSRSHPSGPTTALGQDLPADPTPVLTAKGQLPSAALFAMRAATTQQLRRQAA